MGPPRGKSYRVAVVLFTRVDEHEGLHIHKLEYLEMDQVHAAVRCMLKLRTLRKRVHSVPTEKRSRSVTLESQGLSPCDTKKARTLHAVPTDASLPE